jgi:LacI family transcriptional regulator
VARASVKDVAARAGVSLGTVSNVLNRPDSVRPATRTKVERAILELGFVRNDSARQLRAGSSRTIVYVCLDVGNPFFTDVSRGIDEVAAEQGLAVFLCNTDQDEVREQRYLEQLLEQQVRGVCITPVDGMSDRLRQLTRGGVPVVFVDRSPHGQDAEWCSVGVDDVLGGELATTHLLDLGHEQIAFTGGPHSIPQVADRLLGAERAMRAAGSAPQNLLYLEVEANTVAEGRRAGARLLGVPKRRRPTAIFCANDLLALGVLQQMTQRGLSVPGDLAIVGYDDIEFAAAAAVPLTSVSQPRHQLGRAAAELLVEEADARGAHRHRQVSFDPELIVRQSSGG